MSHPNASHYLLLFRHSAEGPEPTPADMEQIFVQWRNWMKSMQARGQFVGANRLEDTGAVIRPLSRAVSDGPFAEAKEIVGGYIVVAAGSLAEAIEIGQGCPGLELGGVIVEVRPVEPLPPV